MWRLQRNTDRVRNLPSATGKVNASWFAWYVMWLRTQ